MAHIHEGSYEPTYLTHKCKSCGQSTGRALNIDMEPHLCDTCLLIEKREAKLNKLLNKNWWKLWK